MGMVHGFQTSVRHGSDNTYLPSNRGYTYEYGLLMKVTELKTTEKHLRVTATMRSVGRNSPV